MKTNSRKNKIVLILLLTMVFLSCGNKISEHLLEDALTLLNGKEYVLKTKAKLAGKEMTNEGGIPLVYKFKKTSESSFSMIIESFTTGKMPLEISLEIDLRAEVSSQNKGWVDFKGEDGVAKNLTDSGAIVSNGVSVVGKINPLTKEINFKIDYKVGVITTTVDVLDDTRDYAEEQRIYNLIPSLEKVFSLLPATASLKTSLYKAGELKGEENTPRNYTFKKISPNGFALDMLNFKYGKMPATIGISIKAQFNETQDGAFFFVGEKGQLRFAGMDSGDPKGTVRGSINPETKEIVFELNFGAMDFVGKVDDTL